MSTPIDFSAFAINRLKIHKLTKADLVCIVYKLLKGTCKSSIELEYNLDQCYNALTNQLEWTNPEGDRPPYDLSKPLLLQGSPCHLTIPVDFFFNNDLKYLKTGNSKMKYTLSITKIKSGRYKMKFIEEMIPKQWNPVKNSTYLGLRKKYCLNLMNDMPPRDKMDDPNITMEEYIRIEEEKARKHGKVFNWETAKYGKICSLNNDEINFRISFDEFDDEDYTVVFEKNSFSYKIIFANDLKTDSETDNEKVNMPSFPSPEPTVSCLNDLDFFKDFENEFPAIVYNDVLTSKSDFSTKPTLCPQHIDEFDLKDETSFSEYDEEEQNVLYFNDLFPFNIIYPDDLKSDKDNHDNKIDIIQSSGGNLNTQGSN
ncbi:hypothetical protein Tco_0977652 [Tanacetum coccineum]|uniref:Uncharacterized protein n=1 Tax=Tanacetum coccineum TaxID=301880 RepID=A0ABQ5EKP4_9ASTR